MRNNIMGKNHTYSVIDLFCGAGGFSLGFELTHKFRIIGAVDNWNIACDTFRYNHPDIPGNAVVNYDLNKVFNKKNLNKLLGNWDLTDGVDVILGGPPCQGMSLAGKRLSEDPRNQLFNCFVKLVDVLKPKIFIMENVPGLLSAEDGMLKNAILNAFKDINYDHFTDHVPVILKAECYGVPQIRRRLFFVGIRSDLSNQKIHWPPRVTHQSVENIDKDIEYNNSLSLFENVLAKPITVEEAVSDLPFIQSGEGEEQMEYPAIEENDLSEYQRKMRDWNECKYAYSKRVVFNHVAPRHTKELIEMIRTTPVGQSVDPKYSDSKKWFPDRPGFTVKALGAGGGSTNRRAFHYNKLCPRGSTVRENARIQSFPDWYRFLGPKTHQMSQVGNAVPPLLAKSIAISVSRFLDQL